MSSAFTKPESLGPVETDPRSISPASSASSIPEPESLERYSEGVTICMYYPSFGSPEILSIQPGKATTQPSSGSDTAMNLAERLHRLNRKGRMTGGKKTRKTRKTGKKLGK